LAENPPGQGVAGVAGARKRLHQVFEIKHISLIGADFLPVEI